MSTPPEVPRGSDVQGSVKEGAAAVREAAQSGIEEGMTSAASVASDASDALDETAASLYARGQEGLSQAASAMSRRLSQLADYLEGRSTDELVREARRVARDNPAMFIAGGLALGIALSRFFKASSGREGDSARPDPASPAMRHSGGAI
jgi:hypothetical protein